MATFQWIDRDFPWTLINKPGIQGEFKKTARKGAAVAKGIAANHVDTGQLLAGISVGPEVVLKGKIPVTDWMVHFDREDIEAIEYGGLRGAESMYSQTKSKARWVPGLHIVARTLNAMGG